jgi:hypothetical protein
VTLGYVGFKPHRSGRIHLFCPGCRRKLSNMPRDKYDPPKAVLVKVFCDNCSVGGKDSSQHFRDARGRHLCSLCGRSSCELAEGRSRCDERLIGGTDAD